MSEPEDVIPLVEERLILGKRVVPLARVRVETVTETVEDMARLSLDASEVEVRRVPVGREVTAPPAVRTEGDVTIVPVVEEELVVTKRLVLKEELHIIRRQVTRLAEEPVILRRQRARILRVPARASEHHEEIIMADTADVTMRNLTAFFDEREDAERAMTELRTLGVSEAHMRLTGGEDYAGRDPAAYREKGFWESIADFFFPDEDRVTYAEGLRRGGYLLTLSNVPVDLHDQALDILEEHGSVDLDERSAEWRSEGWSEDEGQTAGRAAAAGMGAAATGAAFAADYGATSSRTMDSGEGLDDGRALRDDQMRAEARETMADDVTAVAQPRQAYAGSAARSEGYAASAGHSEDEVIPVLEERLRVGKRDVNLGRVRVRSYVVEEPVSESVTLRQDHVEIDRRPVDRELTGDEAAFRDRVIEAEEHAEEAVISKEARVTEEISLRRSAEERTETVNETLRHTEVEIEDERHADRLSAEDRLRTDDMTEEERRREAQRLSERTIP